MKIAWDVNLPKRCKHATKRGYQIDRDSVSSIPTPFVRKLDSDPATDVPNWMEEGDNSWDFESMITAKKELGFGAHGGLREV